MYRLVFIFSVCSIAVVIFQTQRVDPPKKKSHKNQPCTIWLIIIENTEHGIQNEFSQWILNPYAHMTAYIPVHTCTETHKHTHTHTHTRTRTHTRNHTGLQKGVGARKGEREVEMDGRERYKQKDTATENKSSQIQNQFSAKLQM